MSPRQRGATLRTLRRSRCVVTETPIRTVTLRDGRKVPVVVRVSREWRPRPGWHAYEVATGAQP